MHLLSSSQELLEYLKEARLFFDVGMVRIAAERATQSEIIAQSWELDVVGIAAVARSLGPSEMETELSDAFRILRDLKPGLVQ